MILIENMHPAEVLKSIYQEHGHSSGRMADSLMDLDVSHEDLELLRRLPWPFLANRIAVERERLDLPPVHPLLHWKLPAPPPDWLTPAICKKIFELALENLDDEDREDGIPGNVDSSALVLPA